MIDETARESFVANDIVSKTFISKAFISKAFISKAFISKISLRIKIIISRYPALYLTLITVFAFSGFAYLLLFPFLTLVAANNLLQLAPGFTIPISSNPQQWIVIGAWYLCMVTCLVVSYRMFTIKISPPTGLKFQQDKAPELFRLIAQLHAQHAQVKIDNIILTQEHKIEIIKTPVFGLPVWNKITLAIGLPVMINLSDQQFKSALIRKFYQFSKANISLTNWIFWLRHNWSQYNEAYSAKRKFGHFPLTLFFKFYTPKFNKASALAVRMDELKADSYTLNEINDGDLLDMIQGEFICKFFLENTYWPKIRNHIRKSPSTNIHPHEKMAQILAQGLPQKNAMHLLASAYITKDTTENASPTLKSRLNNIGHLKIKKPKQVRLNAAQTYLGDSYNAYVKFIDKAWMATTLSEWKKQDRVNLQEHSLLKLLKNKACISRLSYKEMWQYAKLTKKIYGNKTAISFKNIMLRKLPQAA